MSLSTASGKITTYAALEHVRSAHNVGSVFRTADAAGVGGLHLIGTTPTPTDRFGRPQPEIAKTALGAEESVPYTYHETTAQFIAAMREDGIAIVAVEQTPSAVDYKTYTPQQDTVFVFGNEVDGVSDELLAAADATISIPMHGTKESLNVSVAAGIVLYQYSG